MSKARMTTAFELRVGIVLPDIESVTAKLEEPSRKGGGPMLQK
jgi:hypothetical protein